MLIDYSLHANGERLVLLGVVAGKARVANFSTVIGMGVLHLSQITL
jgi:hypothetical protein